MTRHFDKQLLIAAYRGEGCLCCGDTDVTVINLSGVEETNLHFHHVDPVEKLFEITSAKSKPWDAFLREIEKTVVLCSVCHRRVHANKARIERGPNVQQAWICRDVARHRGDRDLDPDQ
jgi:hypothetical protein